LAVDQHRTEDAGEKVSPSPVERQLAGLTIKAKFMNDEQPGTRRDEQMRQESAKQ
jgi:hypothetical protein